MKRRFTLHELTDHLTGEVLRADAHMQLQQGAAWRDLTRDTPLAAGAGHLAFLGMQEVTLRFGLKMRWSWYHRVRRFLGLPVHHNMRYLKLVPAKKSPLYATITLQRNMAQRYTTSVDTNLTPEQEQMEMMM